MSDTVDFFVTCTFIDLFLFFTLAVLFPFKYTVINHNIFTVTTNKFSGILKFFFWDRKSTEEDFEIV